MLVAHEEEGRRRRRRWRPRGEPPSVDSDLKPASIVARPGLFGADHAGIDEQGGFERGGAVAGQVAIEILLVHEDIGADLEFGEHAQVEVDRMGAGAASR